MPCDSEEYFSRLAAGSLDLILGSEKYREIIMTKLTIIFTALVLFAASVAAQTTEFTYQGQLQTSSAPATGSYDFEFLLFDASVGGSQVGATLTRNGVAVANGIFSVNLDFGASFPGANRFLEIHVRQTGGGAFTPLTPRQSVTSAPYSVKSLTADTATSSVTATNATTANGLSASCVGCVTNAQIGSIDGAKVTGTVANATNATNATTATDSQQLGGVAASQYLQTNGNGSGLTNLNAGSITAGTLSNSRLGQIPTANIADSAVTSPKIASGQVVKGVTVGATTLTDNVTLTAGSNITITPAGNTLTIASTSGGVGGSGMPNRIPLWNGVGTTIGDSAITQNGNGVQLPNGVQLGVGAQGNNVAFGSPNGETGMTIAGASGRADVRFDGATLKLVAGGGGLVPPSTNGIAIDTQGLVGIGTNTPQAKLAVNAGGSGGEVRFSAPSGESGMSIVGTNRADVRFDGQTLKLLAGPGTGAMASTNGININGLGNVGIGTTTPAHRLSLIGGPPWTSFAFTGALELGNTSAIGWRANAAGNRFGIGQTNGGLVFLATLSDPGTTGSPANYVMVINDNGNITQPINNNGLVKAMVMSSGDGILRCYNGITNSSTGNCGFTLTQPLIGVTRINFGFPVSGRFVSVSAEYNGGAGNSNVGANYRFFDATSVEVFRHFSGSTQTANLEFTLIMY